MSRKLIAILALVCAALTPFVPAGHAQDKFTVPPEDAKKVNPLKNDASTIASGKKLYSSQCYFCHGKDGDGKGELAGDMKVKLDDFHDPTALKDKTDGELFYILSKGKGDMPGQGDRLSETQRWQLIAFIRSLAGKPMPAAAPAKDEKKPD